MSSTDLVLQVVPIGFQWPTVDPFLFCVHHLDEYPAGNDALGPAASLDGRSIGNDFAGTDGWRMYHGSTVPGFPQHPHRGFETVTFVRRGLIDHSDSLGATARFGRGDVQWLTAGSGIVHCEMFPLVDTDGPNTCELFQIWMNLPAADKMADPHFTMLWDADIPRLRETDDHGRTTVVTIVAGAIGDHVPPPPPPSSWASRPEAEVAIWHVDAEAGATWTLPPATGDDTVRTLYVFGGSVSIDGQRIETEHAAVVRCDVPVEIVAGEAGVEILVLQGRPIGEPVVSHGPFVMNTRDEIVQAFEDYRRTEFGGWPWPSDDPVHAREAGRFADRGDGRVEHAPVAPGQLVK